MIYPYFVANIFTLISVGIVLIIIPILAKRYGNS